MTILCEIPHPTVRSQLCDPLSIVRIVMCTFIEDSATRQKSPGLLFGPNSPKCRMPMMNKP